MIKSLIRTLTRPIFNKIRLIVREELNDFYQLSSPIAVAFPQSPPTECDPPALPEQPVQPVSPPVSIKSERLELFKTATGNFFLPADAHGDIIANAIKNNAIFDTEIYNTAKKFISPHSTALDIGSNFGQMAILMAKHVQEGGVVHAFEADPFLFDILTKNIEVNTARVIPHPGAVYHTSGETLFFPEQDFIEFPTYGSYGIDYVHGKGRPVKSIAIDDLVLGCPVSFMKIDVQGGDLFVMQGARATIDKYRMPIIFEYEYLFETRQNLSFQEYIDFVASIDYRFVRVFSGSNFLILPREAPTSLLELARRDD